LGLATRRGHSTARFFAIRQPWLRDAIKRWSRFRLGAGYSFTTIDAGPQSLARFSIFLSERPEVRGFRGITVPKRLVDDMSKTQQPWSSNPNPRGLKITAPRGQAPAG
jgi:hypothetical protein